MDAWMGCRSTSEHSTRSGHVLGLDDQPGGRPPGVQRRQRGRDRRQRPLAGSHRKNRVISNFLNFFFFSSNELNSNFLLMNDLIDRIVKGFPPVSPYIGVSPTLCFLLKEKKSLCCLQLTQVTRNPITWVTRVHIALVGQHRPN